MDWRRGLTYSVAVAAFALTIWLAAVASGPAQETHHPVSIAGPEGPIWTGTVTGATPLAVLVAAAEGNFTVEVRGTGATAYVVAIDGHAEGPGGWCFLVEETDAWRLPPVGAGAYALDAGQAVRWEWTPTRCEDLLAPSPGDPNP